MKTNEIIQEDIYPQVGDHFDIELGNMIIESTIVSKTEDGFIIEADDKALALMKIGGALFESYNPTSVARDQLAKGMPFKTQNLNQFSDPKKQQEYQRARLEPKNHPGFLGKMTENSDDVYTIENPDLERDAETGREEPDEIQVKVDWSSYDDEFEIDKIVRVDTGEDITKKVNGQAYWNLSYDVQQRLQQQRSRGDYLEEAEYQGRKVPLSKPMRGDVKKFKVYVKNEKGNVIKVNFGDKNMKIKKSNPKRRKSFRARHNCANPGPKTKARYWSCRKW